MKRNFRRRILSSILLAATLLLQACAHAPSPTPSAAPGDAPGRPALDPAFASRAVKLSLHCVDTEAPHYKEPEADPKKTIRRQHPAFFGCYDWHSAVHGHWAMLRAVDQVENLPEREAIIATLNRHLTAENLKQELEFLQKNPHFEEPYGWGWFLRLCEELRISKLPEAKAWAEAVAPLEKKLVRLMLAYLRRTKEPYRKGLHDNTAYAMVHAWDYARGGDHAGLEEAIERAALRLFRKDSACNLANEPGPYDFISPCFVEADIMRRILPPSQFADWFRKFLPTITAEQLRPVPPKDLKDPYQVHLVGLMYQKSSAMTGVARVLAPEDPRRALLLEATQKQIETAGKLMFESDYGGTHWLASFALYYYTGAGL